MNSKSGISVLLAVVSCVAAAETVTLAPAAGVTTNAFKLFTGDTAVEIAGPGTVALNPGNSHTGGTTLSGGTLLLDGTFDGVYSPVGAGTFTVAGGTLRGSGTFAHEITGTGATTIEAPGGWAWTGSNTFVAAATVADGTLEIAGSETAFSGGLAVADGASVSVTGGTLGISTASGAGTGAIDINGGTIRNVSTFVVDNGTNWFPWIQDTASVSIGAEGAVFKDGGTTECFAQISTPLTSSAAQGETAAGVTFDGGKWGYYAAMAYDGPTILKNGATLFFGNSGYLPSTSAVTVGAGSELRNGNTDKDIASLTIEEGGIIGSVGNAKRFTVTGPVVLPKAAKVAVYNGNFPSSGAKTSAGTYAVLRVPVAYAEALRAVLWTCATATNKKSYKFSVATSGSYATLSVTIADAPAAGADITVAAGETLAGVGAVSVGGGNITVNGTMIVPGALDGTAAGGTVTVNAGGSLAVAGAVSVGSGSIAVSGTMTVSGTLDGTAANGSVTVNNGGVLDVTGNIQLSSVADGRFDLYVNDGGTLRARQMNIAESLQGMTANSIHFDGATVQLVATVGKDNFIYFPRCATAYIGAKGVTFDLSDWDADGRTGWFRFSCMGLLNSDPALDGAPDGGITVRGTPDGKAIFYFGSGLNGATLKGGVTVEAGGKISAGTNAFADDSVTLLPGSLFKSYNKTYSPLVKSLTVGAANGAEPVALQTGTAATGPALVIEALSVLSPVEFSTAGSKSADGVWNYEAAANPGVYTALVYRTASPALDTSLFRLPAKYAGGYSLSAETVALTEGDYAGYTALVLAVAQTAAVLDGLVLKDNDAVTLSADADYSNIYVGDDGSVGFPVLTLDSGNVKAGAFHLAYKPTDGKDSTEKHVVSYIQNGGLLTVNNLYTMYLGKDQTGGRVSAEVTLNDGTLAVSGNAYFGYNRTRQGYYTALSVNGGTMTVGGDMVLTYYTGKDHAPQGIVFMNGGTLSVAGTVDLSACTNNVGNEYKLDGGIFLRGGVLSAKNIVQSISTTPWQRLVFDGGTYAPNAAAAGETLSGLTTANVSTNGAIVSTEKLPAGATYTIAQNLLKDPGLGDAADGGFTKRGAGTLALSGENTFTGPTVVEAGTLAVSGAEAISDDVTVADGAVLDLGGSSVTLGNVAASGVIENGSLSVTGSLTTAEGSFLNVGGDLTLVPGMVVDFAGSDAGWRPLAAVSGTVTVPSRLKARNAGGFKRCKTSVIDGVVYVCPTTVGFMLSVK